MILLLSFLYIMLILLNLNSTSNSLEFQYPTEYTAISSYYGNREMYGTSNFHNGIDFLAPMNSEVFATNSGYIEYAAFLEDGYGNTIIISHNDDLKSLYCHLSENFIVEAGQYVNTGDVIGYVGPKYLSSGIMNGNTTGPHLHFSIFKGESSINPLEFLQ